MRNRTSSFENCLKIHTDHIGIMKISTKNHMKKSTSVKEESPRHDIITPVQKGKFMINIQIMKSCIN